MKPTHRKSRIFRKPLAALGLFALFAGMLFWTKLRLVSDIPRTAYAVPEEQAAAPETASDVGEVDPRDDTEDDAVSPLDDPEND